MSKFNITVELDWLDDEFNLESQIKEQIITGVASEVQEKIMSQVENECKKTINDLLIDSKQKISDKLNAIMTDFFNTPHDITDKYGDVVEKNVTVTDTLKRECDNFLNEPLDERGKPCSSYNVKYKTRVDYIVSQSISHDMEWAIKSAVTSVTNDLKERISGEIKSQMGNKLAEVLDLDKLIKGK